MYHCQMLGEFELMKEALFPVNNLAMLNPDCHLPRTYLISHFSKYSIIFSRRIAF